MLLSICVPTYNRGERALGLAKELDRIRENYIEDVEIVISNNGSTVGAEYYSEIAQMAGEGFVYHVFDTNRQFVGNFNQVIRLAKGDFCLLLSDEDSIEEDNFDYYIALLKSNPSIGIVRARSSSFYRFQTEDVLRNAGREAIDEYFLMGNYISGAIYNRRLLTNEIVDEFENKYLKKANNRGYYSYPHLFVEAYLLLNAGFLKSSKELIFEGEASDDAIKDEIGVPFYASYGERLDQARGYFEFVKDLHCTEGMRLYLITKVISKTVVLVRIEKDDYLRIGFDWSGIVNEVRERLKSDLGEIGIPVVNGNVNLVHEYIDSECDYCIEH